MSVSIDLNCDGAELKAASIGHGRDGYVFRFTIGPISEDLLKGLHAAARVNSMIRLMFPEQPLLLERVAIEQIEPRFVRIFGHIVDGRSKHGLGVPPE